MILLKISILEWVLISIMEAVTIAYIVYCIVKMVKTKKGKGKNENKGSKTKTN